MRHPRRHPPVKLLLIFTALVAATATTAQQKNTWNSTIEALAAKITRAAGRSATVHIQVKNLSSLDATRVADFEQQLEANLQRRGAKPENTDVTTAEVTVSDNLRAFIFTAEVTSPDSRDVIIASIDRNEAAAPAQPQPAVRLQREIIWSQPDPLLDFILLPATADATPRLVILEPRRLVIYRSENGRWQPQESHPLPVGPTVRDPRGTLMMSNSDPDATIGVDLLGAQCTLKTRDKLELTCPTGRSTRSNVETDVVSLPFNCGFTSHALLTSNADWTQPDSLRVVEVHDQANQVGEAMSFPGPILALSPGAENKTARAIWRNLATGDYEAGTLTATCGP